MSSVLIVFKFVHPGLLYAVLFVPSFLFLSSYFNVSNSTWVQFPLFIQILLGVTLVK